MPKRIEHTKLELILIFNETIFVCVWFFGCFVFLFLLLVWMNLLVLDYILCLVNEFLILDILRAYLNFSLSWLWSAHPGIGLGRAHRSELSLKTLKARPPQALPVRLYLLPARVRCRRAFIRSWLRPAFGLPAEGMQTPNLFLMNFPACDLCSHMGVCAVFILSESPTP